MKNYKKLIQKSILEQIDGLTYVNRNTKLFCKMLLEKRHKNSKYSEIQRRLEQSLEFRSHSTYNFLRNTLNLQLPTVTSIYNCNILHQPGFNKNLIEQISIKIKNMSERDKQHVLLFDEIKIRADLKYNRVTDHIVGFVDLGNDERELNIAKYVCLFMSRACLTRINSLLVM